MTRQAEGLNVILLKAVLRVGCHAALASRAEELQCWRLQCYRNGDCSCTNCVCQSVKISWKLWISQHPGWANLGFFISTWHCTNSGTQVQSVRCFPEMCKFCALMFLVICCSGHLWSQGLTGWLHQPFGRTEELLTVTTHFGIRPSLPACWLACLLVMPSVQPLMASQRKHWGR